MAAPLFVAFALLQASAAPLASAPATPAPMALAVSSPDPAAETVPADPMICRRVEVAGSPFAVKQCHRISVWNRMARDGG